MSRWYRKQGDSAWIMGVLNCTPDSFSDGGKNFEADAAIAHGLKMRDMGAAIIDVGGESTRPGAAKVDLAEELRRTISVVRTLVAEGCAVSIDTMKAEVMRQAIEAGAVMVNDVSALNFDSDAPRVVADAGVDVCLMHMQGTPETMQVKPGYSDVVSEVGEFLERRIEASLAAGIAESALLIDPGIGFGKRLEDNLALLSCISELKRRLQKPLLLGVSRKSFLGLITGSEVDERELETAAANAIGVFQGADLLRVHEVGSQHRAAQIAAALGDVARNSCQNNSCQNKTKT